MTALEALKARLLNIQQSLAECVTEEGKVKNEKKYQYQLLVWKERETEEAIQYLLVNGIFF